MAPVWIDDAVTRLARLRRRSGAWGYRRRTASAVEPTALAALALLAADADAGSGQGRQAAQGTADWLKSIQKKDGSLPVVEGLEEPCWATPFACLLWGAVGGFAAERDASLQWLLSIQGVPIPHDPKGPFGHDTTLIGWPWIEDTHSWVEPTSFALLALGREGRLEHPRARQGLQILRDRAIPGGGWNYGNRLVFGTPLRPAPAPTGAALLALALAEGSSDAVGPAIGYLRGFLPSTRAPISLGWGVLGLRSWTAAPEPSASWLAESYNRIAARDDDDASGLALLLLAACAGSLDVLGVGPRTRIDHNA